MLLQLAVGVGVGAVFLVLSIPAIVHALRHPLDPPTTWMVVLNYASVGVQILAVMWTCAAMAYAYAHLRTLKEGPP